MIRSAKTQAKRGGRLGPTVVVEGHLVDLSVTESTVGAWVVLAVRGEVDVHSAPEVLRRISKLLEAGEKSVVVDLDSLTFIDSTGLGTMVAGRNQAAEADAAFRIVCKNERVLKLFRITGLDDVFDIFASTDDAVAAAI